MDQAIEGFRSRFEELTTDGADPLERLIAVIHDCFQLSERDIQRNRVLVAEQGLLSARSDSPREEQARQAARARTRDLEFAWASFLSHAMQQGAIPKNDPRLLTRAILGLYNSVWHWYRPNGIVALARVAEFFTDRSLALVGVARRRRGGRASRAVGMTASSSVTSPRSTARIRTRRSSSSPTMSSSRSSGPAARIAPAVSSSAGVRSCARSSMPAT